jgi:hypothetical protein
MGYFSSILAEPAAVQAGRLSAQDLGSTIGLQGGQLPGGLPAWQELLGKLNIQNGLQSAGGGLSEGGAPMLGAGASLTPDALKALEGFQFGFDRTPGAYGNTGELYAIGADGQRVAAQQSDTPARKSVLEAAALAAAGFGGLGLMGLGPAAGFFGGAGATGTAAAGTGGATGTAGVGAATAGGGFGGTAIAGQGLIPGASAGYGSISGSAATLGAGASAGAGTTLGTLGAGLTAPAGMTGGIGLGTAAAGAGGITSLLQGLPGTLKDNLPSLIDMASGVYGMKLAGDAREASDPFAKYREGYGAQLAALEANPNSIVTRPGFEAGLEAIQRTAGARGYAGSGNMISALGRYGGEFYNQEANRLATLAGAGQTPGAGQLGSAELASKSLGSIGYAVAPMLERLMKGNP